MKNKKGGFADLFVFMILIFVILVIGAIMIYVSGETNTELKEAIVDTEASGFNGANSTQVVEDTIGETNRSYSVLYWVSVLIIFGMIVSIFIGSYLVTTKPVFMIPYLFIAIIATFVSASISNAYEFLIETPEFTQIFANYLGANFIMLNLPLIVFLTGLVGAVIMFSRLGSKQEVTYGY